MNKWLSIGRLTKDIEGKTYGKDNKQMAFGTIAVQRDFKTNGEYQADFFNFTLFGGTAKYALQYLKKGDLVSIEGSLQNNNYEIDQAIEDRQSHVNGAIRNIMYMSKNRDYDRLHSTVGYYKKQADNKPQGQMFMTFSQDDSGEIKMVNHYPNQSYQNLLPHDERVKSFMKVKHSMREYLSLSKGKPLDMNDVEYQLKLKRLELEINEYLDMPSMAERKENESKNY